MTESFHDSSSHEKDRIGDGLIEIAFRNGQTALFQAATVRESSQLIDEKRVHYEVLSNHEGYEISPYIISNDPHVLGFGNDLEHTSSEGYIALYTKRHASALGFLAIVETLADRQQRQRLVVDIHEKFRQDSTDYPLECSVLVNDESYDLWVRLEFRRELARRSSQVMMAKLAFINTGQDKITMIPYVVTHDGSQIVPIPDSLHLGHPWLYVGGENYDSFTEDS